MVVETRQRMHPRQIRPYDVRFSLSRSPAYVEMPLRASASTAEGESFNRLREPASDILLGDRSYSPAVHHPFVT